MEQSIYHDLAVRTRGAVLLGVVGPVRTGKSTFIKRFMETMILPEIEDAYVLQRARDELPQSGSGRSIMTTEPKFIPEEAVTITLEDQTRLSVRMIDSVGYMVEGATGQWIDGSERMVTTPWFDHEVPMSEAAESGTKKVIAEHSTVGVVVTTDGSICEIPREAYAEPEARVIRELQALSKPFVVLLNCVDPGSNAASTLASELSAQYGVACIPVNCQTMQAEDFAAVMRAVLLDFPAKAVKFYLPDWFDVLEEQHPLRSELCEKIRSVGDGIERLRDCQSLPDVLGDAEQGTSAQIASVDLASGVVSVRIDLPRSLYYAILSESTGEQIENERELVSCLLKLKKQQEQYLPYRDAIASVLATGYGVVIPQAEQMQMEQPQIVRRGGKYCVRMKASAPAIHMMATSVETEVSPALGGEGASEEILSFLLQGFEGDVNRIWESNIVGRSLNEIAADEILEKLRSAPESSRKKLQETLQKIVNDGSGTLFCILL